MLDDAEVEVEAIPRTILSAVVAVERRSPIILLLILVAVLEVIRIPSTNAVALAALQLRL